MTPLNLLFILLTFLLTSCDQPAAVRPPVSLTGRTMGTTYHVKFVSPGKLFNSKSLHNQIDQVLKEINQKMSTYIDDSELSQLNRYNETEWYDLSNETREVIEEAIKVSELSSGALDITVGALVELWGFGWKQTGNRIPSESEIKELIKSVNYQQIETRSQPSGIRKLHPDITIDLSSTAKGYAVDQLAELLERSKIVNYLVEIGGEMRARGMKDGGKVWTVAIEKPSSKERSVQQLITLQDKGMATSGDYRNYFEKEGVRYSHTLDPRTGKPIVHNLGSVSVIEESSMAADAWATAFMVLGVNEGMKLARKQKIAAYFIVRTENGFAVDMTPEFKRYLLNP